MGELERVTGDQMMGLSPEELVSPLKDLLANHRL